MIATATTSLARQVALIACGHGSQRTQDRDVDVEIGTLVGLQRGEPPVVERGREGGAGHVFDQGPDRLERADAAAQLAGSPQRHEGR